MLAGCLCFSSWYNIGAVIAFDQLSGPLLARVIKPPTHLSAPTPSIYLQISFPSITWVFLLYPYLVYSSASPSSVHNSFCLPVCHFQQELIDWALCRDGVHAPLLDDSMTHFRSNLGVIFLAHCNPFFIVLRWLQPLLMSLHWVFIIFKHSACLYLLWRI